jgi:hypothetical protein
MRQLSILVVEDDSYKKALEMVEKYGYRGILSTSVRGTYGVRPEDPSLNWLKMKNSKEEALGAIFEGESITYFPGADEILENNKNISGVLLDMNYPLYREDERTEHFGEGFSQRCLGRKIPCVICTAVKWTEKDEERQSRIHGVPVIGRKDWERAMTKLHELIVAKNA